MLIYSLDTDCFKNRLSKYRLSKYYPLQTDLLETDQLETDNYFRCNKCDTVSSYNGERDEEDYICFECDPNFYLNINSNLI